MSRTRKTRVPSALPARPGRVAAVLLGMLALAGCSQTDPYQRAGIWKPSGVNDANIAAMAANPADLTRGRGDNTGGVRTAATAVEQLWRGGASQRQGSGAGAAAVGAAPAGPRPGGSEAPR